MLHRILTLVAIACTSAAPLASNQDQILKPVKSSLQGPVKMMVFIPGANVPTENYLPTVKAIQVPRDPIIFITKSDNDIIIHIQCGDDISDCQAASEMQLWAVIPAMLGEKCIILCPSSSLCAPLQSYITKIIGTATAQGYNGTSFAPDTFVVGHSLGGVCVDKLAQAYVSPGYQAAVILGAYTETLVGAGSISQFPIPVMIVGAELDGGLGRPGMINVRLTESDAAAKLNGTDWQTTQAPVVILPHLDHSSFCPGFRVPGDIFPSEASEPFAMNATGSIVSSFLHLHANQPPSVTTQSKAIITQAMAWTRDLLTPFQKAYETEGGNNGGNHQSSHWCRRAQLVLAGAPASDHVTVNPVVYKDDAHDFEHTRIGYQSDGKGGLLLNASGDPMDRAAHELTGHDDYYSGITSSCLVPAASIDCKMVGAERVAEQLKITNNTSPQCKDVNQLAIDMAMQILATGSDTAKGTLKRFQDKGRKIMLADDFAPLGNIGPLFVKGSLKIVDSAAGITVSSIAIHTQLDSKLFPGVHYCKLLSPARVLDYVFTDSLKPSSGCLNV